jgi:hypothetical protein
MSLDSPTCECHPQGVTVAVEAQGPAAHVHAHRQHVTTLEGLRCIMLCRLSEQCEQ